MLVGDHPPHGSVHTLTCPYAWAFECDYRPAPKDPRCPRTRRVRCEGGPHILLDEAYQDMFAAGWVLVPDGTGWRCPEHREAAMEAPKRRRRPKKAQP